MLGKIKQMIKDAKQRQADRLDAVIAESNDPLASQIEWTPTAAGGANFQTQKLIEISPLRMEFRPTLGMKLFCGVFFVIGVGVFAAGAGGLIFQRRETAQAGWFLVPFGLIFAGVGAGMYHFAARPKVFDLESLWYWKGKRPLDRAEAEQRKDAATLDQVHAIQLIREHCTGNKSSYYSYEINLVMHDGTRVNVVDHGKLSKIRADADRLGRFLGVPVWDATGR